MKPAPNEEQVGSEINIGYLRVYILMNECAIVPLNENGTQKENLLRGNAKLIVLTILN